MPTPPRWKIVSLTAIAALTLVGGCTSEPTTLANTGTWLVDSTPVVQIGMVQGDAAYEFDQANSAVRLVDGRILVANSGSEQLRYFDSAGKALGTVGREGQGPGDFDGVLGVYPGAHDSLVIFSSENRRYTVVNDSGRYLGTLNVEASGTTPFPWDDWLTASSWVRGVRDQGLRPCVARVLASLPLPPDSLPVRRALVDDLHAIWVQPASPLEMSAHWAVYSLDGSGPVAVTLPPGVELFQAGADFVLGRRLNTEGVEQIVMFRLRGRTPADPAACPLDTTAAADTMPSSRAAPAEEMKPDLRNFMVAQETYYAGHGSYASSADSTGWTSSTGNRMWLMRADRAGWFGFMTGPDHPTPLCAAGVGGAIPPGWESGALRCQ